MKRQQYLDARVQNYAATRSPESLARMLVDLEEATGSEPEFLIDEEWPAAVRSLQRMPRGRT